jgi:hypothetical protein
MMNIKPTFSGYNNPQFAALRKELQGQQKHHLAKDEVTFAGRDPEEQKPPRPPFQST